VTSRQHVGGIWFDLVWVGSTCSQPNEGGVQAALGDMVDLIWSTSVFKSPSRPGRLRITLPSDPTLLARRVRRRRPRTDRSGWTPVHR